MVKIVHGADFHLSAETKEYSLDVISETAEICSKQNADFLILSGDIFNSFEDAEKLRSEVASLFSNAAYRIIAIPGNHEFLRAGNRTLDPYNFGRIEFHLQKPFSCIKSGNTEILCIPWQKELNWKTWKLPDKEQGCVRIALYHGVVEELVQYTGPDTEDDSSCAASDMFLHFRADYAALGHIHRKRIQQIDSCMFAYPGSAVVWRSGEEGERSLYYAEISAGAPVRVQEIPLKSAGIYREYSVVCGFDGTPENADSIADDTIKFHKNDLIKVNLSGITDTDNSRNEAENKVRKILAGLKRPPLIINEIQTLSGLSGHPLVKSFLNTWKKKEPLRENYSGEEEYRQAYRIWILARQTGLSEIHRLLK